eukprot:COSAG01_NODE_52274_length_347_cov_21.967742_1_plen_97_part_10
MACGAHGQLVQTGRQWRCTASCAVWAPGWPTVTAAALLLHRGPAAAGWAAAMLLRVVAPQAAGNYKRIQSGNRLNMCNVGIASRNGWGSLIVHNIHN